jgi:hypothetical protein
MIEPGFAEPARPASMSAAAELMAQPSSVREATVHRNDPALLVEHAARFLRTRARFYTP